MSALTITSPSEVTRLDCPVHLSRETQEAADSLIDWAELHEQTLRAGLFDARLANAAERACEGHSFCQGIVPCYPHCAEMAVASPDLDASAQTTHRHRVAPRRRNRWGRIARALVAWLCSPDSGLRGRR
jgi:hypothetical protein